LVVGGPEPTQRPRTTDPDPGLVLIT